MKTTLLFIYLFIYLFEKSKILFDNYGTSMNNEYKGTHCWFNSSLDSHRDFEKCMFDVYFIFLNAIASVEICL